jgi:hypothetical protein
LARGSDPGLGGASMKRKKSPRGTSSGAAGPDPAFEEIDAMVRQADAEFKAVLGMVKPAHRARFLAIVEHTDAYCMNHLEPLHREYETLCHVMAAALCRKGSPVVEGKGGAEGWAAAIVAALGFVNFLSDREFPPVKTMEEVAAGFGVSASGMHAKSRQIRKMLDLTQFDPDWTLPSLLDRNPLVWMMETTSGLVVDIRGLPRAEQVRAFEAGLIPYIPADREAADGSLVAPPPRAKAPTAGEPQHDHAAGRGTGKPPVPARGPSLFDSRPEPTVIETKPEHVAGVIGRIGPRAAKGRK